MSRRSNSESVSDFDLDDRELCPDGACIGVIGPDGRCKECGAKGSGAPKKATVSAQADDDDLDDDDDDASDDDEMSADDDSDDDDGSPFDDDRKLCPDGACIGVIGPNGRCKECGKKA